MLGPLEEAEAKTAFRGFRLSEQVSSDLIAAQRIDQSLDRMLDAPQHDTKEKQSRSSIVSTDMTSRSSSRSGTSQPSSKSSISRNGCRQTSSIEDSLSSF